MTASGNFKLDGMKTLTQKGLPNGTRAKRNTKFLRVLFAVVLFISLGLSPAKTFASNPDELKLNEKYQAELAECIDGDSAQFKIGENVYKTRFLYIETPDSTFRKEPMGEEAAEFACTRLQKGKEIILETDGDKLFDDLDRLLAWVWVDGKLLQEELAEAGFVRVLLDYGDYKYEKQVHNALEAAKKEKRGLYGELNKGAIKLLIFTASVGILAILGVFISKKFDKEKE